MLSFFCNDPATTEIYTLSLHDALPISRRPPAERVRAFALRQGDEPAALLPPLEIEVARSQRSLRDVLRYRSEEHTSELQSRLHLVCRLLLEKKKKPYTIGRDNGHRRDS